MVFRSVARYKPKEKYLGGIMKYGIGINDDIGWSSRLIAAHKIYQYVLGFIVTYFVKL